MKKNSKHFLLGRTVMVDPAVTTDPTGSGGRIATVIDIDPTNDTMLLKFSQGAYGEYASTVVLTLYPKKTLVHALHANRQQLDIEEYRQITQVLRAAQQSKDADALWMATSSTKTVSDLCTLNCRDLLDITEQLKRKHGKRQKH